MQEEDELLGVSQPASDDEQESDEQLGTDEEDVGVELLADLELEEVLLEQGHENLSEDAQEIHLKNTTDTATGRLKRKETRPAVAASDAAIPDPTPKAVTESNSENEAEDLMTSVAPSIIDDTDHRPAEISKKEKRRAKEAKRKVEEEAAKQEAKETKKMAKKGIQPVQEIAAAIKQDGSVAAGRSRLSEKGKDKVQEPFVAPKGKKGNGKGKQAQKGGKAVVVEDDFAQDKIDNVLRSIEEKRQKMVDKWGDDWQGS